jgi:hypothetical protein
MNAFLPVDLFANAAASLHGRLRQRLCVAQLGGDGN